MARKVSIGRAFEAYEVDIDGTVVTASIDVRDSNVNRTAARLMKNQERLDGLRSALPSMDADGADGASREVAAILRESISDLIGEAKYAEILRAVVGDGADPADANFAMAYIFSDLFAFVVERLDRMVNSKQAKYLSESAARSRG